MKTQDSCNKIDPTRGGVTLELNEGMVLHIKKGKLIVCTCKNSEWACHEGEDGNTWCKTVCVEWDCKTISTNDVVNKAIINELTKG